MMAPKTWDLGQEDDMILHNRTKGETGKCQGTEPGVGTEIPQLDLAPS